GLELLAESDRPGAIKKMIETLNRGYSDLEELTIIRKDGTELPAETVTTVLHDANGNPVGLVNILRDITERKRTEKELNEYRHNLEKMVEKRTAELKKSNLKLQREMTEREKAQEALRTSEEKLRTIFETIGDAISVIDMEGKIIDENEAGLRIAGYARKEDILGLSGLDFVAEEDRERVTKDFIEVLNGGHGITSEYKLVNRRGKKYDIEVTGSIIRDASGNPSAIVNVIRDVTERKLIEEALRESEKKYRTLVEQSTQGIAIIQDGRIVFANKALSQINGYELKELYRLSPDEVLDTVQPDDRKMVANRLKGRTKGKSFTPYYDCRVIRKDGSERWVETFAKRIIYKGKPAIQTTAGDITDRKKWEEELKKSKEELSFYLSQLTQAQEEERGRIARELHDDTIQELVALSRQLDDLIDKNLGSSEDRRGNRKLLEETQQKITAILEGIRRFTRDLRPSVLDDLGLLPALEWLTSELPGQYSIPITTSITGSERRVNPDVELAIFRIAQEALRNACRHSEASVIQLSVKFTSRKISLKVSDNGKGFLPTASIGALTKDGKLGLAGMHERAQLHGAGLSIKSKSGTGTTINLEIRV
ncbi:MAG: PAS domain S-box protein, partial [Chloroflexota bacterium]|nr:PAS domain S-box protein [Chloroflexota bacterium]